MQKVCASVCENLCVKKSLWNVPSIISQLSKFPIFTCDKTVCFAIEVTTDFMLGVCEYVSNSVCKKRVQTKCKYQAGSLDRLISAHRSVVDKVLGLSGILTRINLVLLSVNNLDKS